MLFLNYCLLLAFFVHSLSPIVTSEYVLDTILKPGAMANKFYGLAAAVYQFTIDLHEKILESNKDGNIFFSPISIYAALAMVYAGSEGETKEQLKSTLHLNNYKADSEFYDTIKRLHQALSNENKSYVLQMANRLYGQKGLPFKANYIEKTKEYFDAGLEELNFKDDPSGSRSTINNWVERMTSGMIKDLLPPVAIDRNTLLTLVNAIYFNGSWLHKFDKERTAPDTFHAPNNQTIKVPMMRLPPTMGLLYASAKGNNFRFVELPYTDKRVSMIIALDDRFNDFDLFLRDRIIDTPWDEFVDVFTNVSVRVSLPKFTVAQTMNLKDTLQALGLENLFDNANLSGIADSAQVKLSDAYHKAHVSVGELGTEAAAATGLGMTMISLVISEKKIIDFNVNRPFVFLLVEKTTGCILFFGHIKNPLQSN